MAPPVPPEVLCLGLFVATFALLLAGYPVAFTLAGTSLIFAGLGALLGVFDFALLTAFPQRIFATMSNEILVAVPLFVLMGVMLERSRIAEELLDEMGRLARTLPGGLALAVTLVGALLAASTGIVGATVVTMGLISLPAMLKRGYHPSFACGSIAASGTLGQIIPPSIILVLLGDQLSTAYQKAQFDSGIFAPDTVTVTDLFAGALLPGLLLVCLYLAYQLAYARLNPAGAPAVSADTPERKTVARSAPLLRTLAAPALLILAVLGSILAGIATPTEAAGMGAAGAFFLTALKLAPHRGREVIAGLVSILGLLVLTALFDLRLQRDAIATHETIAIAVAVLLSLAACAALALATYRIGQAKSEAGESVLGEVVRSTARLCTMVFTILIGAAMFSLVFRGLNGDVWLENALSQLPGGTAGAIFAVMAVMFLLGFFLDFLEIVFIVVPIVAPILLKMEIAPGEPVSPVWLGVMIAVNLQTSFLTPPFGFSLFYLRGVAPPQVRTADIYRGVAPFIALQLLCLLLIWMMPGLATWLPKTLYGG